MAYLSGLGDDEKATENVSINQMMVLLMIVAITLMWRMGGELYRNERV